MSCTDCGACCISDYDDDRYIELDLDDYRRLPHPRRNFLVLKQHSYRDGVQCFIRTKQVEHVVCAALSGKVGESVRCTIYEDRPGPCRDFRPGTIACNTARWDVGLPTLEPR